MIKGKLIQKHLPADYADCFHREIISDKVLTVDRLFSLVFKEYPKCVVWLLKTRDALVKPFGLKGGISFEELIIERNSEEIILGKYDKHLIFWVSVYSSSGKDTQTAAISTVVKYNNLMGRVYFYGILVFHKIVVGYLFRRALRRSSVVLSQQGDLKSE